MVSEKWFSFQWKILMENIIFKIIKGNNNEDLLVYVSSTLKKFLANYRPIK